MLQKKNTSLAKPLRSFSQCIPLFLEFSGTFFPSTDIFSPLQVCLCCPQIYCSCTWMNVLQRADTTYGLYCVCRHISPCGPLHVGTAPTLFPRCPLLALSSSVCCCCVLLRLLFSFCAQVVKRLEMLVDGSVKWPVRKLEKRATRLVMLSRGSVVSPPKQEHCATVGGFYSEQPEHTESHFTHLLEAVP